MSELMGALLREWDVIGCKRREVPALVPVSRTKLRELVKLGLFPAPIRLPGSRSIAWRRSDVLAWLDATAAGGELPSRITDAERRVLAGMLSRGALSGAEVDQLTAPDARPVVLARLRRRGFAVPAEPVADASAHGGYAPRFSLTAADRARAAALGVEA